MELGLGRTNGSRPKKERELVVVEIPANMGRRWCVLEGEGGGEFREWGGVLFNFQVHVDHMWTLFEIE